MPDLLIYFQQQWKQLLLYLGLCSIIPSLISLLVLCYNKRKHALSPPYSPIESPTRQQRLSYIDAFTDLLPAFMHWTVFTSFISSILIIFCASPYDSVSNFTCFINHNDTPSVILSSMLAVIGMLSICTAVRRKYSAFVNIQDIFSANKVGKKVFLAVCFFLLYVLFEFGCTVLSEYVDQSPNSPQNNSNCSENNGVELTSSAF